MPLPRWTEPQLSKLATEEPTCSQRVHEIKFDGYRMAARIDNGDDGLLTRSGVDWTARYPAIAAAFAKLKVRRLTSRRALRRRPDDVTPFEIMISDRGADTSPISLSTSSNSTAKTSRACRYWGTRRVSWLFLKPAGGDRL